MNCSQIEKLLPAHHDGELDAAHEWQVGEHLADCPQCFAQLRSLSSLRRAVQAEGLRFTAPGRLRATIRAELTQAVETEREARAPNRWPWAGVAAALVLGAGIVAFELGPRRGGEPLLAELTESHIRSLMVDHLMDVASTDQHTVKPWFDGKLDFAPPVKDLKASGFPLLGGRLDYAGKRAVAALVYGRQKHFINLFVWPGGAEASQSLRVSEQNGYHVVQWSDGKMNFVAVSDLNAQELKAFAGEMTRP